MSKWCPQCKSVIYPPDNSSMLKVSAYFQHNRCYICNTPLSTLPTPTFGASQVKTTARANTQKDNSHQIQKLKFEHERKQSEIMRIQTKISQLQMELNRANDDWEEAYNRAASRGSSGIEHFDASGFQNATRLLGEEIGTLTSQVGKLEREMADIERKLESLW